MSKLTSDSAKAYTTILIGVAIIVLAAIVVKKFFGGIDGLLEKFGFKDDAETKQAKEDTAAAIAKANNEPKNSPWNPNFYKSAPSGSKLVTAAIADAAATKIYDSSGYLLPDRPEQAFAALKQMPSQTAVSWLAERFELKYKQDLLSWLQEAFNDTPTQEKYLAQMLNYVTNLPKY